jgi:hypothetical protein
MLQPEWAYLKFPQIDFQDVIYYSAPKSQKKLKSLRSGSELLEHLKIRYFINRTNDYQMLQLMLYLIVYL